MKDVKFFVSPAIKLNFFNLNFYGYNGYSYRINAIGEKHNYTKFNEKLIEYKLKLFSGEFLLNFFTYLKSKIELKANLGFGIYSVAFAVDHHILRNLKFFDIFHFQIFLFSSELAAKYLLAHNFGFFANTKLLVCYSNKGRTVVHFLDTGEVASCKKGAAGFRTTQINFSLGAFFRIAF
ncbi:MAG: omptin family outer membrane protease [Treponemataceae bacterium]